MGKEKAVERTKALISNGNIVGDLVVSKVFENQKENESKISYWCRQLTRAFDRTIVWQFFQFLITKVGGKFWFSEFLNLVTKIEKGKELRF